MIAYNVIVISINMQVQREKKGKFLSTIVFQLQKGSEERMLKYLIVNSSTLIKKITFPFLCFDATSACYFNIF